MTSREWALAARDRVLLHTASLLVPARARPEWLREWKAELWHVRSSGPSAGQAFRFCLGAIPDAVAMCRLERSRPPRPAPLHRSAGYCLLLLALTLAVSCGVALRSPAVLSELDQHRYVVPPGLVLIRDAAAESDWAATISVERYRQWASLHQRYFTGLAYYLVEPVMLSAGGRTVSMPVAYASPNLFSELKLRAELGDTGSEPGLVLSSEAWKGLFAADPGVVGRSVQIGGRAERVRAVLPEGAWRLPGHPGVWLLEPEEAIPPGVHGYVVAELNRDGWQEMWNDRVRAVGLREDGDDEDLWIVSVRERIRGPWEIYLLSILLSLLALPALTSISFAEDLPSPARPAHARRAMRRAFFIAKFVLLLGVLLILPLDLAYHGPPGYVPGRSDMHLVLTLSMSLLGFWWVVSDQRRRCPVCLRHVTHPARVGIASQTFLAWNGTELMCLGGHTLLHVPALPTSWFNCPEWVYLDDSWEFLFSVLSESP